ncbi:MAG: endonuclease III domain-containing protein [Planctomycetota bacterium]
MLRKFYDRLLSAYGPQGWWPAETPTEVVIGAILTQNTSWKNVERAIANLQTAQMLSWTALRDVAEARLAELLRPSGTYRVKARRLKAFVDCLWQTSDGDLARFLDGRMSSARKRLLSIPGIGSETADAILLYAAGRPTFVVDAYTRRILQRHGLIDQKVDYEGIQQLFHRTLTPDAAKFNEYHALLVEVGKRHCRAKAACEGCPLADLPHDADR